MLYLRMQIHTQMKMGGKTVKNIINLLVTAHLGQHLCADRSVRQACFGLVIKQCVISEVGVLARRVNKQKGLCSDSTHSHQ